MPTKPLELWGGVECTCNRIQEQYLEQMERSGHVRRLGDLELFASLGIRKLRYPILWEKHAAEPVDWSWTDERLQRLRDLGIEPIIGLVHHGSGPPHTSLLDPAFATGLARHARAVAERYPWLRLFNPVNEPLTTARFSGLYGHWYPHHKDPVSFGSALMVQCDAVRQAMRAIREVIPEAQLVQTEDMGKTFSTRLLAYQAEFENERRWMSLDLLCGRFTPNHPVWHYLISCGVTPGELETFVREPCPPDILGINYYVTGERFLDERLAHYPSVSHGGNGRQEYADVEAVRVCSRGLTGVYGILKDTWDRFHLPIAVTEAHLACTREEQIRWLMEVWESASQLHNQGANIEAVTVWSLLGAYDWDSLVTRAAGNYESGAFDVRGPKPRPTAIARCMQSLATRGRYRHPIMAQEGWWQRPERLLYPPVHPHVVSKESGDFSARFRRREKRPMPPLLITGRTGTLGQAFTRMCKMRGLECRLVNRQEMDIADAGAITAMLEEQKPWAVINCAGYVRVDQAEAEREKCLRENFEGPAQLARACQEKSLPLVTFSSDLVFGGSHARPYVESDAVNPLNLYGQSKALAEKEVLRIFPRALIIRTSAFFSPWDRYNFVTTTLENLRRGEPVQAAGDVLVSPTYLPHLVNACLDLLIDEESGIWHLVNAGAVSWAELARKAAVRAGLDPGLIEEKNLAELNLPAERPRYSVLASERGQMLPTLDQALEQYFADKGSAPSEPSAEADVQQEGAVEQVAGVT